MISGNQIITDEQKQALVDMSLHQQGGAYAKAFFFATTWSGY